MATLGGVRLHLLLHPAQSFLLPSGRTHLPRLRPHHHSRQVETYIYVSLLFLEKHDQDFKKSKFAQVIFILSQLPFWRMA